MKEKNTIKYDPTIGLLRGAIKNAEFDLVGYIQKKVIDELRKKEFDVVDHILRTHIDDPIVGDLTKEKLQAANVHGLIHYDEGPYTVIDNDTDPESALLTFHSSLLGVRQGDILIQANGRRIPLNEIQEPWHELSFVYPNSGNGYGRQ